MKKLCLVAMLIAVSSFQIQAQGIVNFGASGGYFLGSVNGSLAGLELDATDGSGVYLGFIADIDILKKFHVQPELLYANVGGEGSIVIPVMAKYYVTESLNLQAGPQIDFLLDVPALIKEVVNTFGISVAVGAGYDITESIEIQARYTIGLNDRLDIPFNFLGGILGNNTSLKTNTLQAGLTFKF